MSKFNNTKKVKRLIIIIIFLLLFNFCYPNISMADTDIGDRILVGAVDLLYFIPRGILHYLDGKLSSGIGLQLTPENIIKQKFALMDPDIFTKASKSSGYLDKSSSIIDDKNSFRDTIAGWYYALRNFSIVALLSVLIYVAIRMIISSTSSDKAKYKMMFKDWLVALCLLFFMHYIMYGTIKITNIITSAISSGTATTSYASDLESKISDLQEDSYDMIEGITSDKEDELIRDNCVDAFGYVVVYWAVVILTIIFMIKYIIRSLLLIFLTLLAPISCITYPIDKIGDGKSQAFNTWLREYIMQVMIQPFHLLLYTVLIGSSVELVKHNLIYGIMCFAIMIPAEKFVKQMFGINEKLGSPLGAMASGAALSKLASSIKKTDKSNSKSDSKDQQEPEMPPKERPSISSYDNGEDHGDSPSSNDNRAQNGANGRNEDNSLYSGTNQQQELPEGNNHEESGSNGDTENKWNPNLTDEQRDELNAEGLETGDDEYDQYLSEHGINSEQENTQPNNNETEDGYNLGDEQGQLPESNQQEEFDTEDDSIYAEGQGRYSTALEQARNAARAEIGKDVRKKLGFIPHPEKAIKKGWDGLKDYHEHKGNKEYRKNMRHIAGVKLGHMSYRNAKRIAPIAGKVASGVTRGALAAGIGFMSGVGTLAATGDISKAVTAAGAGAAIGNVTGKKLNTARSNINKTAGKYINAAYNTTDGARQYSAKKKKQEYIQNQAERDYATKLLKNRNSGRIPSGKEVDEEMDRRWNYVDAGITDKSLIDGGIDLEEAKKMEYISNNNDENQIEAYNNVEKMLDGSGTIEYIDDDGSIQTREISVKEAQDYKNAYENLNKDKIDSQEFDEKFGEGASDQAREHYRIENNANRQKNKFATEAKFAASIANEYKAKDFRDEKTMKNARESYKREFKKAVGENHSDTYVTSRVEKALNDAAQIQGVKGGANFGNNA